MWFSKRISRYMNLALIFVLLESVATTEDGDLIKRLKPRLRHNRHVDDPQANVEEPLATPGYSSQLPKLAVKDNHKPVFKDCLNYRPTVKEEQPINTYVFTVQAEDIDPPDMGGTVTYKFVSSPGEKERFHVDPETGRITTKDIFDHDEPSREKEAYITVRASDNGQPQLDDACTIKIVIEDINDNPPVFDKVVRFRPRPPLEPILSYSESVPQDLLAGREVMRLSATDIDDGNNSIVQYKLDTNSPDQKYFVVDLDSGVIFLNKTIDKQAGHKFKFSAIVKDKGEPPLQSSMALDIQVVESNKKSPSFLEVPVETIRLKENFSDFNKPIAIITAKSNIPEEEKLQFELVQGQTEQTNKWHTFVLEPEGERALIKLGSHLDYERITDYTLTVRITNNYKLAAETQINIQIDDVNDNIPIFSEVHSGTVLENEPPGTVVMQVRAIDYDGTQDNSNITYELGDPTDPFAIDPKTGNITTRKTFDREEQAFYNLRVVARDNSESALTPGKHNSGVQVFLIEIADKNDNPPKFTAAVYIAEAIPENANINELVTQVTALDNDTASVVNYSIVSGNIGDAFSINPITGEIRVNKQLDYETIPQYTLEVKVSDGIYQDHTSSIIKLENLNDNPPVFLANYTKTIEEEKLYDGCIVQVEAYDPDITDRNAPQNIAYALVKQEQQEYLTIDNKGCLRLTKPLDRDPPTGFEQWQVLIMAADHNGKLTDSLRATTEVILELIDINDNAPFLTNSEPVIWYENQEPGKVVTLTAKDNDGPDNGPPFFFALSDTTHELYSKFSISGNTLMALVRFDREEQKVYRIPIRISDSGSPRMAGVSILTVVIGDRNDNPMEAGTSAIFAYNYKGTAPDMEIGRVYVNDPDDWDLADKKFRWRNPADVDHPHFDVSEETGMITMTQGTLAGVYNLEFTVSEENHPLIPLHYVDATVNVTVKLIPEEAVDMSGSIRFLKVSPEDFIVIQPDGSSMKDKLHRRIAAMFNVSNDNVDVFTVLKKVNVKDVGADFLDVRFSVHGSPYYPPEKLNTIAQINQAKIEEDLKLEIYMIKIDECLLEKEQCEDSCRNVLTKTNVPAAVFTNHTSFVGVWATVESECSCDLSEPLVCLNGGTAVGDRCECLVGYLGPRCEQTQMGFHGGGYAMYPAPPSCTNNHISFTLTTAASDALLLYMGPLVFNKLLKITDFMSLEIKEGYPLLLVDYGTGTTRLNNTVVPLSDNKPHLIEILTTKSSIEMFVDKCKLTTCMSLGAPTGTNEMLNGEMRIDWAPDGTDICKYCYTLPMTYNDAEYDECEEFAYENSTQEENTTSPIRDLCEPSTTTTKPAIKRKSIMVKASKLDYKTVVGLYAKTSFQMPTRRDETIENPPWPVPQVVEIPAFIAGPLLLGGPLVNLREMAMLHDWKYTPGVLPLVGCISNFTFNKHVYNLGAPSMHKNAEPSCSTSTSKAISFAVDYSFLIAILVCIAILIVLLLAVVVHRRRSDTWAEKELDDIRENIIAYEDEGGGEGDAGYDLHVLRQMYEGRPPEADRYMHTGLVAAAPDISGILDDKKSVLDRDADVNPLDDVRHYAYEGDGNSTGSLSSLASSGTEDGDQNFDFLMNYGAPFKKLVDMYGDPDPRDRESHRGDSIGANEESWC